MTSCPEALTILGIRKKKLLVEIQTWARPDDFVRHGCRALVKWVESWDSTLEEGRRFSEVAKARPVGVYEMCHALIESVSWELKMNEQSAEKEIVSLSLVMSKNLKLTKVIKSFVPEPKKKKKRESSSVLSVFGFLYMFMNICERFSVSIWKCLFHVFISWSYFWT